MAVVLRNSLKDLGKHLCMVYCALLLEVALHQPRFIKLFYKLYENPSLTVNITEKEIVRLVV